MKISTADVIITGDIKIPRQRYRLKVLASLYKESAKGNPMVELDMEIIAPEEITNAEGQTVDLRGKTLRTWWMFTENRLGKTIEIIRTLDITDKIPVDEDEFDTEAIEPNSLKGLCFDAILFSVEKEERMERTAEQAAKGEQGTPITGADGEPLKVGYNIIISSYLGNSDWADEAF